MRIEIDPINNGWVVKHDIKSFMWDDEVFFKTVGQAIAYAKRMLSSYLRGQNEN